MGYSQAFTATSAVTFIDPEQTTLEKPLDQRSEGSIYGGMKKFAE